MLDFTKSQKVTLPVIKIKDVLVLPFCDYRFEASDEDVIKAINQAMENDRMVMLLFTKADGKEYFETGVIARIGYRMGSSKPYKIKVIGSMRAKILKIIKDNPVIAEVETIPVVLKHDQEEEVTLKLIDKEVSKSDFFRENFDFTRTYNEAVDLEQKVNVIAYFLKRPLDKKLYFLEEPSALLRARKVLEEVLKQSEFRELEDKIEEQIRKNIADSQKEYYLREKIKVIQEELGDKALQIEEVETIRENILKAKMPKEVEEKMLKELERFRTVSTMSPEYTMLRSYLDFVVGLPWGKESVDNTDIHKAKEQLDKDHYGLEKVKERILEYLAVKIMSGRNPQTILCFAGPPGVGKTSLAKSIASALNKKFVKQSLGGISDESEIRGHRRTYVGALPGRILQAMQKAGTSNPVFLLDEIDKVGASWKGSPEGALLEVLDPEQNRYFSDHYLEEPYDLSKVFFITTANFLQDIPIPLRDRLEIVELSSYTEFEKLEIAKRHLIPKQLQNHGLTKTKFKITDSVILKIIRDYTMEAGVRELERILGNLIRKSIKKILSDNIKDVSLNDTNIGEWLGKPKFFYNKVSKEDQVGIVMGLAYTQFGGDTLAVEVTTYAGDGKLTLTGQLGDVMKESAQAALSYIKAHAQDLKLDSKMFETLSMHIHVPEGATPKDGPSAGVTLATAIASALTKRKVDRLLGMTGEITLRGIVLPIGGLREKAIAAHRSGLKRILIPKENERDIEEIPESVRKELTITLVSTIDEVFKLALK